jgi:hypothetical protein
LKKEDQKSPPFFIYLIFFAGFYCETDFFVKTQYLYEKINFYEKMAKEKNLVEEALIQMKNLEEAVAENAKGILASTMKEEIKELVKESIVSEQGEEEDEIETTDDEMGMDDMDSDDEMVDMDDMETMDSDDDMDIEPMDFDTDDTEMDDEVIDLSGEDISDEDLLKVFLAMDENDGVIVKKDDKMINLKDENTDKEYMIQTESEEEMEESYDEMEESMEEMDESYDEMEEEMYEEESMGNKEKSIEDIVNSVFGQQMESDEDDFDEEVVYEIEMDEEEDEDDEQEEGLHMESTKPKIGKGAKIGKPKFSYKSTKGGFKEDMKQGTRGVGMGKPKFEFKEGKKDISSATKKEMSSFEKKETKEAARTLGMGSKFRKGGLPKPRAYSKFNMNIDESKHQEQINVLREKNEEYRKALNVFRDKLNEVAIFNSNLAYATRLFTEHSTSKQEKINILRRFDSAETLKESKNLYRTIKDELSSKNKSSLTESIEEKIEKTPSSGSASTLIESKTYENPQFLRMKDIMSKIIK